MKVRIRAPIPITAMLIALICGGAWFTMVNLQEDSRTEVGRSMLTILGITHQAVQTWVKQNQATARIWAETDEVKQYTQELLRRPRTPKSLTRSPAQYKLRTLLSPVIKAMGYRGFFVIGQDGTSIASTRNDNVGGKNLLTEQPSFIEKIRQGEAAISLPQKSDIPLDDETGAPTMFVGAPIQDKRGKVMAILAFRIDPAADFTALFQRGRVGQSGDTYALDRNGLLITESRYEEALWKAGLLHPDQNAILNLRIADPGRDMTKSGSTPLTGDKPLPLTRLATGATAGHSGMDLQGYRDYRGVPVVGAWLWDPDMGFAIASEMGLVELQEAETDLKLAVFFFTLLAVLALAALAWIFERNRVRISRSEERYRTLVERMNDGLVTVNADQTIAFANGRGCEIFGGTLEQIVGQPLMRFIAPGSRELVREEFARRRKGEKGSYETFICPLKGGLARVLVSGEPILDDQGAFAGSVAVLMDVTELRQAEEDLKRERNALAHVGRLSLFGEMATSLAHELNQPLTVISGSAQVCLDLLKKKKGDPKTLLPPLEQISGQANRANNIIHHIRSFIRKGEAERKPTDLNRAVRGISGLIRADAREHGVELVLNLARSLPTITVDPVQIEQIIVNFAHNGLESMSSTESSERILTISSSSARKGGVTVCVADTGPSVTQAALNKSFEPFHTTKPQGLGMGLSICRSIVEAHGGTLHARPNKPTGAVFCFTLPTEEAD